jgi:hypothetical protein
MMQRCIAMLQSSSRCNDLDLDLRDGLKERNLRTRLTWCCRLQHQAMVSSGADKAGYYGVAAAIV